MRNRFFAVAGLTATIVIAACADKADDTATMTSADSAKAAAPVTAPTRTVAVHAKNYTFDLPDTIAGGVVKFELINEGPAPEIHHISIARVLGDYTSKDFMEEMKANPSTPPAWAKAMGGPNPSSMPGVNSNATMDLKPGRYIAMCFVPGPDGVPHIMKGMIKDFVVTAAADPSAALPPADVTIKLADYSFTATPALSVGHHAIRVENDAAQEHEVILVKLNAGKTVDDVLSFIETMKGPPPGAFVGGVSGISNGAVNQFDVDLEPGDYALICLIPDAKDAKPHAMHGMKQQIKVM
jgi:uncharacterized lipoprotein YbaY